MSTRKICVIHRNAYSVRCSITDEVISFVFLRIFFRLRSCHLPRRHTPNRASNLLVCQWRFFTYSIYVYFFFYSVSFFVFLAYTLEIWIFFVIVTRALSSIEIRFFFFLKDYYMRDSTRQTEREIYSFREAGEKEEEHTIVLVTR